MGLQQFERRLERLVEGTFAKAFRGQLQPVELGKRLTREMDLHRAVSVRGLISPNAFDISLAPDDFERFGSFLDVLAEELVEAAQEHARSSRYSFVGPIEVVIGKDAALSKSTFTIESSVIEGEEVLVGNVVLEDGRRIGIGNTPVTIGRLEECEIQINDTNASRRHAELRRESGSIVLIDLSSTNGTRVNNVIISQHRLVNGDVISIGTTTLRFEMN
ncbi:MAG TPA: DUF3662 and FHA domain-containing protein [Acidimicrobiales bacterium]|nr:DUF3662 and FHA domain-containing protein [Acidimicrobiales bacterium]